MNTILRNFLVTLKRFKVASSLNILGLSVAFAAFIVIMMQVNYDRGFDRFEAVPLRVGDGLFLPLVGGKRPFLALSAGVAESTACLPKGETADAKVETPAFVYAGVREGDAVGRVVFTWNGQTLGTVPLCADEDAPVRRLSFWEKLFGAKE